VRQPGVTRCAVCRVLQPSPLAGIRSAALFAGPLQRALHRLKYRRDVSLADALAPIMLTTWREHNLPAGMVMPVPLSAGRLRERGYNQAGLLARGFADLARLPYADRALRRVRHTESQVHLSAVARRENVASAFAADGRRVKGQIVILVDDVCTTGATLAACAEALRAAGASQVWGLTLGRAISPAHHAAGSGARAASHRR
jgi:ComF family protein